MEKMFEQRMRGFFRGMTEEDRRKMKACCERMTQMSQGCNLKEGAGERMRPVIMTALAAGLAPVPFALAADKPGNEILSPLAVVILGAFSVPLP